jgi:hypothetical protein
MRLYISPAVQRKLSAKHKVTASEVVECFANRLGPALLDTREDHQTDPPTKWFIAETDMGRKLKIVYIRSDKGIAIKTAYPPNPVELDIYARIAKVSF